MAAAHGDKLAEYGLQNAPRDAFECLRFAPGEMILREGEEISRLALVMHGRSKVCRTAANGKSLILFYYVSGGMIGEVELMGGKKTATASVVALSAFECVAVRYRHCLEQMKTNTVFLSKVGTALAGKLMRSSDSFASAALCSGEQRLCAYILQTANKDVFSDVLTDVSCSVGMSYRHVFRLLGRLCGEGVLKKQGGGYVIARWDALVRRAEASSLRGGQDAAK